MYSFLHAAILKNYKLLFIWLGLPLLFFCCRQLESTDPENGSTIPLTPADLKVYSAFDGMVGIEWALNNVKARYKIYRSSNKPGNFQIIGITSEDYFVDRGLDYDSTYFYRITALNNNNQESSPTDIVSAVPKNIYKPYMPTFVLVNAQNMAGKISMSISWNPPIDHDIDHYEIFRDTIADVNLVQQKLVGISGESSFTDSSGIKILKNYYYRISAVDRGGLMSEATSPVSDFALDLAIPKFPLNDAKLSRLTEFRFAATSRPAFYKLVITNNLSSGVVKEFTFESEKIKEDITVDASNLYLEPNKVYYWQVLASTKDQSKPNSYSEQFRFTITPN